MAKGLTFDAVPWRFVEKDAIAFSGQGRVPVLIDGEHVVFDSWSIATYLEDRYPDRASLFHGEGGRAVTRFVNAWADGMLIPAIARMTVTDILAHVAEKDRAYVRTGFGGQRVVVDGGSVVLPIFQSTVWVNLQTLRLDVHRDSAEAMITKDRMRVDIGVEFYVRVRPDASSIALAAQTLGQRTNDVQQLRELVEAKFVDALRSVAATMSLADLQEKRSDFVKAVQSAEAGAGSPVDALSDRELEVLQLLGKGGSTRSIAEALHLSVKTIETHRAHIKEKLGLQDSEEMVKFAIDWVAQQEE